MQQREALAARGRPRQPQRGFTLIEVMIAIAIMAIVMCTLEPLQFGLHDLNRESDYRYALANANTQLQAAGQEDFDTLPPQSINVFQRTVRLCHAPVQTGSVQAWTEDGQLLDGPLSVRYDTGEVTAPASWLGHRVWVDYRYEVPDVETHSVSGDGHVELWNQPVLRVVDVQTEHGDGHSPVDLASCVLDGADMHVPTSGVVQIRYLGGRLQNVVQCQFLDDALRPCHTPTDVKLVTVEESYGNANRMKLSALRIRAERAGVR